MAVAAQDCGRFLTGPGPSAWRGIDQTGRAGTMELHLGRFFIEGDGMEDEAVATSAIGVAQVFDLHALKAFAPDKRVRKMLFKTDQLWSEIVCYEPGQSTVMHSHPREEEAIYVLQGTANMSIDGEEVVVPAGAIVKFPSNVPHDVRNLGTERCVIMFLKVNPKVLKAAAGG
jgi:quercetin dioxygenase-like cupin family protein